MIVNKLKRNSGKRLSSRCRKKFFGQHKSPETFVWLRGVDRDSIVCRAQILTTLMAGGEKSAWQSTSDKDRKLVLDPIEEKTALLALDRYCKPAWSYL